jgi:hypothetical protein
MEQWYFPLKYSLALALVESLSRDKNSEAYLASLSVTKKKSFIRLTAAYLFIRAGMTKKKVS